MATVRLTNRNDTYSTKSGDEFVYALKGNDRITIKGLLFDEENDRTSISVYGGPGNDQIVSEIGISGQDAYGGPGDDRIVIQGGDDVGGAAFGAGGDDVLVCIGGGEGCLLDGGAGNDRLTSEADTIAIMDGGPGRDQLTTGPESNDTFRFAKGDTVAGTQRDVIKGFVQGQFKDKIDLSPVDANINVSGNQAFTFVATTMHPAIGQVSYCKSGTSTIVVANDGAKTFEIELQTFGQPMLATDFVL